MGWLSSLFGGTNRLRVRDIAGSVVVGGNSGIVYQISNGGESPEPPTLPWTPAPPATGPFLIFDLLSWKSRLSRSLIGREQHQQDLLSWATSGRDLRIRMLTGPGGAGKTRLAAEIAESLRKEGWHAGFTSLEAAKVRPLSDKGLLLIIDYPEEWREEIRTVFQSAARMEATPAPIRVLLLSRQPLEHWRDDIAQAGVSPLCDSYEVTIGPLETDVAVRLFHTIWTD
jgi:ATPase family associated with various cellular activities (AAA)